MSFKRPKVTVQAPAAPEIVAPVLPPQGGVAPVTARRKRLATGGVQGTFLGSLGQAALGAPAPSLTGTGG